MVKSALSSIVTLLSSFILVGTIQATALSGVKRKNPTIRPQLQRSYSLPDEKTSSFKILPSYDSDIEHKKNRLIDQNKKLSKKAEEQEKLRIKLKYIMPPGAQNKKKVLRKLIKQQKSKEEHNSNLAIVQRLEYKTREAERLADQRVKFGLPFNQQNHEANLSRLDKVTSFFQEKLHRSGKRFKATKNRLEKELYKSVPDPERAEKLQQKEDERQEKMDRKRSNRPERPLTKFYREHESYFRPKTKSSPHSIG